MAAKKIIIAGVVLLIIVTGYLAFFTKPAKGEVPGNVMGETRQVYEWAKTEDGRQVLEQIPCYCGCSHEGHMHARHCFWKDNGEFDGHGVGCGTCLHIGKKAMQMHAEGKNICEIRSEIDSTFKDYEDLSTPTPMPAC